MSTMSYLVGVELGGTKSIAVLARDKSIIERCVVPTTTPHETLEKIQEAIGAWRRRVAVSAIGIASFGPIQLDVTAVNHGCLLETPKPGWGGAPVAAPVVGDFKGPWQLDTDVNGAALAEYMWGAGRNCSSLCYLTIGTGVGGGLVVNGSPVHGAMHPEIGHLKLRRAPGDHFAGACPFHGDCIEGLVSGTALARRFDGNPAAVPDDDPRWQFFSHDLAELVGAILLTVSANRVLIGGGVTTQRPFLFPLVREQVVGNLASYLPFLTSDRVEDLIAPPGLGADAGPLGGVALAIRALEKSPA